MKNPHTAYKVINIINIRVIRQIRRFDLDETFHYPGEKHDYWEAVYISKGAALVTAGTQLLTLNEGDIYFHAPNEYHKLRASGNTLANTFIIAFTCNSQYMKLLKETVFSVPQNLRPIILRIFEEASNTFNTPITTIRANKLEIKENAVLGGLQMIKIYLEQLMILLLRQTNTQAPAFVLPSREYPADHIVNNAKKIMLDAVYAPSISSDDLCQQLGYSRTYLCRIFKEECNCTITQYMNQLKIEEAQKLIREENYNFTQISDLLHFANPLYFSRVFRRITDMSPSEYQKLVKANLSGR